MGNEKIKKPMKPWVRAVLAVVAAVGLAGVIVGIVFLVRTAINAITAFGSDRVIGEAKQEPPVKLVEDRLYFTFDGQNTDITNAVDRDLPYIYPYEDPETRMPAYIIVGGDKDSYGYIKLTQKNETDWQGAGVLLSDNHWMIGVTIGDNNDPDPYYYAYRWYLTYQPIWVGLNYIYSNQQHEGAPLPGEYIVHYHGSDSLPPKTWKEDCAEAWVISALIQLELFSFPDVDYSLINPIEKTDEGRVIFVAEGQNTDITDIINEGTPYIYKVKYIDEFGEDFDSYILVGGPANNCGWVLLVRWDSNMWIGFEENITFINEALNEGEAGYETFRQWYLRGVEQIGYNKGTILVNRTR